MFHRNGKKSKPSFARPLKDLTAVVAPTQLLADAKRQDLLQNIMDSSSFDLSRFEQIAQPVIHNLINHCQSLPQTSNSFYSLPGGLLDHALNRTEAALHLFRNHVIQEGAELSEEQKLWLYVLFTAGMLQGIGKLQIDYKVELFDANGQLLKPWNPLLESMASVGSYYHFEFQAEEDENFRCRLNLLLAKSIMPAQGFAWIASNQPALAVWLALLNEDWESAGTLGAILVRANAIAIQRYFNEFMLRMANARSRLNRITTFVDTGSESSLDRERHLGVEFIQWLTQALEKGLIMINKAPLFMVPGGLIMSVEIFKWFVREHPEYKSWQAVQNAFIGIGLTREVAGGNVRARFEQTSTQKMLSGVVFADYAVALPSEVKVNNLNTGKIVSVTATELIHQARSFSNFVRQQSTVTSAPLQHLAANGQWKHTEQSSPTLNPGNMHSA